MDELTAETPKPRRRTYQAPTNPLRACSLPDVDTGHALPAKGGEE